MAVRQRDPYRNFKYTISISGIDNIAGFSSVDGLNQNTEIIEYREGGDPSSARKIPGQTSFENIVLETGKTDSDDLRNWVYEIFNVQNGFMQGDAFDFRRDVTIQLWDKSGITVVRTWIARHAWPAVYEHEGLMGDGNDILIQRLELAHEGLVELNKELL
tara:strand:- start:1356 stop:1835 length:480 start_codon:yes stop_codon:yes gene_type:complete